MTQSAKPAGKPPATRRFAGEGRRDRRFQSAGSSLPIGRRIGLAERAEHERTPQPADKPPICRACAQFKEAVGIDSHAVLERVSAHTEVGKDRSKRQKSGGRKRGTPNKLTRDERTLLAIVVNYGLERAQGWLERVARKQPARALALTAKFAEFVVPRLQRTELQVKPAADTGTATAVTAADVLAAYHAPPLPAPAGVPAAISQGPVAVPTAALIEALEARRAAQAGDSAPALPEAAPRAPRTNREEPPVIDTAPDADGVWQAPPPDPPTSEVARIMGTFAYDVTDPAQVAAIRRRAETLVEQKRDTEARVEVENARAREQQQLRAQRMREAGLEGVP
jgi:hypothetical protein